MDKDRLKELLNDHQLYHSDFQMDYFITVKAGGTPYGQYKQALRELFKRYRGLKQLYPERELLLIDIDELNDELGLYGVESVQTARNYDEERAAIKLAQKEMALEDLEHNIRDTEREFARFYAQANILKEQIGELTAERRAALDRDMWQYKTRQQMAIDLITTGRFAPNTIEILGAVPSEWKKPLIDAIQFKSKRKELVESLLSYDNGADLALTDETPNGEVRGLIEPKDQIS